MKEKIQDIFTNQRNTQETIGITKEEFDILLLTFTACLQAFEAERKLGKKTSGGRPHTLDTAEAKLFFVLYILRVYPSR